MRGHEAAGRDRGVRAFSRACRAVERQREELFRLRSRLVLDFIRRGRRLRRLAVKCALLFFDPSEQRHLALDRAEQARCVLLSYERRRAHTAGRRPRHDRQNTRANRSALPLSSRSLWPRRSIVEPAAHAARLPELKLPPRGRGPALVAPRSVVLRLAALAVDDLTPFSLGLGRHFGRLVLPVVNEKIEVRDESAGFLRRRLAFGSTGSLVHGERDERAGARNHFLRRSFFLRPLLWTVPTELAIDPLEHGNDRLLTPDGAEDAERSPVFVDDASADLADPERLHDAENTRAEGGGPSPY